MQFNEYNLILCLTIQNSLGILDIATSFFTLRILCIYTGYEPLQSANSFESKESMQSIFFRHWQLLQKTQVTLKIFFSYPN